MAKKNLGGAPSKLNNNFLEVAKNIIYKEEMMFLTDEDLVHLINRELEEKYRISQSTFKGWKSGNFGDNKDLGAEFLSLIKDALVEQKKNLFKKFGDKTDIWTKWAWIIERKFSEWNLKQINETKNTIVGGGNIPMMNWVDSKEDEE
jgi:hypothetical protein